MTDAVIDIPEIEIGRYGLRTFNLRDNTLKSVVKDFVWTDGVAVAECIGGGRFTTTEARGSHEPPVEGCSCGIYGTTTFESLIRQYRGHAETNVAVFAAEGNTVLGDMGMRTAAARIVAFWASDDSYAQAYSCCAGVTRYPEVVLMLEDYHFPTWRNRYGDLAWPPAPLDVIALRPQDLGRIMSVMGPLLGPATPGGLAAICHALGYLAPPPTSPLLQLGGLTGT